jgi:hypothetical protein
MWLDSIYMGEPFLMRYAAAGHVRDVLHRHGFEQTLLIAQHVRDTSDGAALSTRGTTGRRRRRVGNATTGRSPSVWGRALGWYAMSLVDLLPRSPAGTQRDQLLGDPAGPRVGLKNTQDADDRASGTRSSIREHEHQLARVVGQRHVRLRAEGRRQPRLPRLQLPAVAQKGWTGMMSKVTTQHGQHAQHHRRREGMGVQNNYAAYVATTLMPLLTDSPHGLWLDLARGFLRWKLSNRGRAGFTACGRASCCINHVIAAGTRRLRIKPLLGDGAPSLAVDPAPDRDALDVARVPQAAGTTADTP